MQAGARPPRRQPLRHSCAAHPPQARSQRLELEQIRRCIDVNRLGAVVFADPATADRVLAIRAYRAGLVCVDEVDQSAACGGAIGLTEAARVAARARSQALEVCAVGADAFAADDRGAPHTHPRVTKEGLAIALVLCFAWGATEVTRCMGALTLR